MSMISSKEKIMNGAKWVVQDLRKHGVNIVFGYPGGAIMPIYDALYDGGVEHLLCRHEQGAAISAIGYARSTGKVGVCIATSGPGATNLITGIADAFMDSVPVIAITGQVNYKLIGTDSFQEIDVLGLSLSCTKHSFLVESIEELPGIISAAFTIASSGRPGPVLIDIPKNIQISPFPFYSKLIRVGNEEWEYPIETVSQATMLIKNKEKPILYVGGGVGMANCVPNFRNFLIETNIPVVVTLKGLGAVNENYPYYLGMLGMHGTKSANLAVQECDLLIAVGARFDDRVTGKLNDFAPNAKVIHMDIDPSEMNKLRYAHVTLQGEIKIFLAALQCSLYIKKWKNCILHLKYMHYFRYDIHSRKIIEAPLLLKQLSDIIPKNTVITTDVGQHQMWSAQHMFFDLPEKFITSSGLGTMGFGIPAAVGAKIARKKNMVICISGDGSFMMNVQELSTIKRKNIPVKILLLDNKRLGMVRQWQQLFFEERYSETHLFDNPNFILFASAFDIPGQRIYGKNQVKEALNIMINSTGPYLLQVEIEEFDNVWPLVPPGSGNHTMLEKEE